MSLEKPLLFMQVVQVRFGRDVFRKHNTTNQSSTVKNNNNEVEIIFT